VHVFHSQFATVGFGLNQVRHKIVGRPPATIGDHHVKVGAQFVERFRTRRVVGPAREQSPVLARSPSAAQTSVIRQREGTSATLLCTDSVVLMSVSSFGRIESTIQLSGCRTIRPAAQIRTARGANSVTAVTKREGHDRVRSATPPATASPRRAVRPLVTAVTNAPKGGCVPVREDRIVANMSETDWSDLDVTELLPTGTMTLVLADVEGSTQLWESQPSVMTAAVAQLNRTASKLIAEHGGLRPIEQGEGDSFVAAFARASDAVACALELQRTDLAPIKLRVGVHTGDVQLRDQGNYAGPTINKAARIRDLAHGGQTVLSSVTADLVEDRLPDGAWLTELGRHQLRDLPRPVGITQLCHPALRNDFPALRTANTSASQRLPVQLTRCIGRGSQICEIRDTLACRRLVTLTGAGGAGKTRLAIEVAGRMADDFPDGIWYVDLAPIAHPSVVPVAVARAFGLPDQPGRSIIDSLRQFVRDRHLLLVLDNCEHLLEAIAALVNDLLAASETVTILATSREPLVVSGE
jgi:class 3 adenylate cyclase